MNNSINWNSIRAFNKSQNNGFEELVCQLAREEEILEKTSFYRLGTPDGGVEAYCVLKNGEEYGWQAKYFTNKLEDGQWQQLTDSFKTAFAKHPKLTKYLIAIPLDREDPRKENQKWFMDKWNEKVITWKKYAKDYGRNIDFEYWGSSELIHRLSLEKHAGRIYYWFGNTEFSDKWFSEHISKSIRNLGTRYIPENNFSLPISKELIGIGCDIDFVKEFNKCLYEVKNEHNETFRYTQDIESNYQALYQKLISFSDNFLFIEDNFPADEICSLCYEIIEELRSIEKILSEKKEKNPNSNNYETYHVRQLRDKVYELIHFAESKITKLYNKPLMILSGEAGVGKSHLLGDYISQRLSNGVPGIFLLGQHFYNGEPWSQVRNLLDVHCSTTELLESLVAKAQSLNTRILFVIDAINEGEARIMWKNHIQNFIETFRPYQKWIGLILSIRSTYIDYIFPVYDENLAIPLKHSGFKGQEYEAIIHFFHIHKLELPNIPIFNPEFSNPLFLLTFCEGLKKRGLKKLPDGYDGISSVFSNFLKGVNKGLSEPEKLNFNKNTDLISDFVKAFALAIIEKKKHYLTYKEAHGIAKTVFDSYTSTPRILDCIIHEGLLSEDIWFEKDEHIQIVRFSYERILDYYTAKTLLDKHLNKENTSKSFSPGTILYSYVKDLNTCSYNSGLLESFSVLLPEMIDTELYELIPVACKDSYAVIYGFIESLKWRKIGTIKDKVKEYINNVIIVDAQYEESFLDTIISLTANPKHYFNADFLHKHLIKFSLSERDAWWTKYIHNHFQGSESSIKRIIDWAWSDLDKKHINDDSIRLLSKTIAWFLTSSNRFLRDAATKALVSLLEDRINLLINVLKDFENVNDPYVTERLFASAYGCAMRSINNDTIKQLALYTYDWAFIKNNLPVHILTRDYIRGIIELGIVVDSAIDINSEIIKPPYDSSFPEIIPSKKEVEKYKLEYPKKGKDFEIIAQNHLYESVMGFEDFARYIIGTNGGYSDFSNLRIPRFRKPYENFYKSLKGKKKTQLKLVADFYRIYNDYSSFKPNQYVSKEKLQEIRTQIKESIPKVEEALYKVLNSEETETFNKVKGYLNSLYSKKQNVSRFDNGFDLSILQRLIIKKVFELGWTKELFGEFDGNINYYHYDGRTEHKAERIGKKYQWISYYEYIARLADNLVYAGSFSGGQEYLGPWQDYYRNIDPSLLVKQIESSDEVSNNIDWWVIDHSLNTDINENVWCSSEVDVPVFPNLIEVCDKQNQEWLVLQTYIEWKEKDINETKKNLKVDLSAYIVHRKDKTKLINFLRKQDFIGGLLPNPLDHSKVFNGEYYKSPAYFDTYKNHIGKKAWRSIENYGKVLNPINHYYWEGNTYDCSINDTVRITKPSHFLFELLDLQPSKDNIHFFDSNGVLVCFDPSVNARSWNHAFVVRKDILLEKLKQKDYEIFWTVIGEKIIFNPTYDGILISGIYSYENGILSGSYKTKDRNKY